MTRSDTFPKPPLMQPLRALVLCLAALGFGGCGPSEGSQACNIVFDTLVDKYSTECHLATPAQVQQAYIDSLHMTLPQFRTCEDVDKLRDKDSFYNDCIPGIQAMTCAQLSSAAPFPTSCQGQLILFVRR